MTNNLNDNLSDKSYNKLVDLVYKHTSITIKDGRKSLLVGRFRPRLRALGLPTFEAYLDLVKSDPDEIEHFIDCITTNKTLFFRTPRIWQYLSDIFIPQWIGERHGRKLQLWSAAASTGEEAHTAGMLLESFREKHPSFDYQIVGTDISPRVIDIASKGVYQGRPIDRFRSAEPEMFQKYMKGDDANGYSVTSGIRSKIRFKTHNLFKPYRHTSKFDIVLCRNVLIYFTKPDQETVLRHIEQSIHPDGVLAIGESETLSPLKTNFATAAPLVYKPCKEAAGKAA